MDCKWEMVTSLSSLPPSPVPVYIILVELPMLHDRGLLVSRVPVFDWPVTETDCYTAGSVASVSSRP